MKKKRYKFGVYLNKRRKKKELIYYCKVVKMEFFILWNDKGFLLIINVGV